LADTEDVLGGRIEVDDEKVVVQQNDAGTQAVKNAQGITAG
jgi:hypothetical protein